jgi:hypothetical protein
MEILIMLSFRILYVRVKNKLTGYKENNLSGKASPYKLIKIIRISQEFTSSIFSVE